MNLLTSLGVDWRRIESLSAAVEDADSFLLGQTVPIERNLTLSDVCQSVAAADPPRESLEMTTRDRRVVAQPEYLPDHPNQIDPTMLERTVMAGATLMITNSMTWVAQLNPAAEIDGSTRLEVNLFLSGPLTQAYPAHFDLLDAAIIQLVGSKGWQLWPTLATESPLREAREPSLFGEPDSSVLLRSGDVLLMPAYTPHLVASTFEPSVHVAIATRRTPGA